MEPITNRRGFTLLQFIRLSDDSAESLLGYSPLIASLVVAVHGGNVLLVFDKFKKAWEVPGGAIETGEIPRECAIRECEEESSQLTSEMELVGIAKILERRGTIHFAAIYSCRLTDIVPFKPNDEIEKIEFWDFQADIGYVDEIDCYLAATVMKR